MIYLIGPKACPNCDEVGAWLNEQGIPWEKVTLDYNEHEHLVETAAQAGYKEAPVGCTRDNDGNYVYVAAGRSEFAKRGMRRAHLALVAA